MSDALGRLTTIYEDPSSLNYSTSYGYDVLNDLTQVSQGSQTRTFAYDSLKRLTSATNPENGTVSFSYDNNGNVLTRTDARSITTTIAYDAVNRPTSKSYNDSPQTPTINFYYDSQTLPSGAPSYSRGYSTGRVVAVTYGGSSAGNYYGFDALGRAVTKYQQTDSVNYLVGANYNLANDLTSETYPAVPGYSDRRTCTYSFDSANRLASLNSNSTSYASGASVSSISYASHDALSSETYGNGLVHAITYNNRLQPNEIKLGTSGSPTSVVDLTYSYGSTSNNGNVQSISYSGGGLSYTQSFSYDSLNRLSTPIETSGGSTSWSQTNGYDQYGNRWIDYGGGSHNLSFSSTTNRITTSGFSYDSAGNLTNDSSHSYSFDAENKIVKVDSTSTFVYDGGGQRVKKLIGENTRFIYGIGGQLIAEFNGSSGVLTKEYIYGASGLVATIEPSGGTKYTTSDVLGSPRIVTNSSGGVVSRHDFMPFGEELFAGTGGRTTGIGFSVSDGLRQAFTLKERDVETGLDYFLSRYYSASQGRFTSADDVGGRLTNPQSLNRYAYVLNDPLKYIDPTGHQDKKAQVEQPKPKTVIDEGKRYRMTVKITEIGEVTNSSNSLSSLVGSSAPLPGPIPRPAPTPTPLPPGYNSGSGSNMTQAQAFATAGAIVAIGGGPEDPAADVVAGGVLTAEEIDMLLLASAVTAANVSEAARDKTEEERGIPLYRGVAPDHPGFLFALEGTAIPIGGHDDPALHNAGYTASIFTSWTPNPAIAAGFAGPGGVVLFKNINPRQIVPSPDAFREQEVLVIGVVTGAQVRRVP